MQLNSCCYCYSLCPNAFLRVSWFHAVARGISILSRFFRSTRWVLEGGKHIIYIYICYIHICIHVLVCSFYFRHLAGKAYGWRHIRCCVWGSFVQYVEIEELDTLHFCVFTGEYVTCIARFVQQTLSPLQSYRGWTKKTLLQLEVCILVVIHPNWCGVCPFTVSISPHSYRMLPPGFLQKKTASWVPILGKQVQGQGGT